MAVFISYSHKNQKALDELRRFLEPLEKRGCIQFWDDRKIEPGMDWKTAIDGSLAGTRVAVLLVCQDFLNSDFIRTVELPFLLKMHGAGRLVLLPVFTGVTNVKRVTPELAALQGYGSPDQPLVKMPKAQREETYRDLGEHLAKLSEPPVLSPKRTFPSPAPGRDDRIFHLNLSLERRGSELHCAYYLPGNDPFLRTTRSWAALEAEIAKFDAILDSGDTGRVGGLLAGALDHWGQRLYELLFGLPEAQVDSIFRQAFHQPADARPTPLRAPLRLRIATDLPELLRLPWRLTVWQGQLLGVNGWEFLPGVEPDPRTDPVTSAPSEVLLLVHGAGAGREHLQRLQQCFQTIWPYRENEPGYLRWAASARDLERVLAGQSPHLVYVHAPVAARGGEFCLELADGPLTLKQLGERLSRVSPVPGLVLLNTEVLPGLEPNGLDGRFPLVVRRRLPRLPDDAAVFPCAWLNAWLREGADPVAALHRLSGDAISQIEAEVRTAVAVGDYRHWRTDRPPGQVRWRLARLHLDRTIPKSLTESSLRELCSSGSRRVMALVLYGTSGNLVQLLHEQFLENARSTLDGSARLRLHHLEFPPSRANLRSDLEDELRMQLNLDESSGESVRAMLNRQAPRAAPGNRSVLWLHWGAFGGSQRQQPLNPEELVVWLEFASDYLAHHCPDTIRLVCSVSLEVDKAKHGRLRKVLIEQHEKLTESAFWLRILDPVGDVPDYELVDYLKETATGCPPPIRTELADLLLRATGGEFEKLVTLLEPAEESRDWYGLRNRLQRETGVTAFSDNEPF